MKNHRLELKLAKASSCLFIYYRALAGTSDSSIATDALGFVLKFWSIAVVYLRFDVWLKGIRGGSSLISSRAARSISANQGCSRIYYAPPCDPIRLVLSLFKS